MTIRNLEFLFKPRSVALIGAGRSPGTVGSVLARNLVAGGFQGDVYPVNPKHRIIEETRSYPDIASLPSTPDLAVVATPAETVPGIISELGRRGTRAAVVITAGFGEGGSLRGEALCGAMLEAARPHLLRIVGPNCFGVMVPGIDLYASFVNIRPLPGRLAFVSQSGAVLAAVMDWATHRRIGFSHLVSLGDMADVDFGDMLDYLARDPRTRAILLYIEAITHSRKFMSAARGAARVKPVIVVKAGRYAESARAAASHTGALAGDDAVCDAAFRRAGILRVTDLKALFDSVTTLGLLQPVTGDRLAILTNGGGVGVMAVDTLVEKGGRLAALSPETLARLGAALPRTWSHGNPVDIVGDAPPERYRAAMEALLDDPGVDALLVINCPGAIASPTEAARAVIDTIRQHPRRSGSGALVASWIGDGPALAARQMFTEAGIPTYETPAEAVRGFMQMVRYRRSQDMLMQTPPSVPRDFTPDTAGARREVEKALAGNRPWLQASEAQAVLAAYGVPVVETRTAATPEAVEALAASLGGPTAVKVLSPEILHKSDVGGVALDLKTPAEARQAAGAMSARIRAELPGARLAGFSVQPMASPKGGHELIVGMVEDPQFGPVILFGQGGIAVEIIQDTALALPPLNMMLAREVISRTRVARLLEGYRGTPAADLEALAFTLVKVSQLIGDIPEIAELDINPLVAGPGGVLALDARIRVSRPRLPGDRRLAIRPYPRELEEAIPLSDGETLLLRPIRPEDEPALRELFAGLSPEESRYRFLHAIKALPRIQAARMSQIDYDREMVLVLAGRGADGRAELYGTVQVSADPDMERAEFAVLVQKARTGLGLGPLLMRRIIDYAKKRGIREIYGDVLQDNRPMLEICGALGFSKRRDPDDPGVMLVTLRI